MTQPRKKLLIVDVAALGWDLVTRRPLDGLSFHRVETVFPALTCTVQASLRTASLPRDHGMVANGLFFRHLRRVMFWEQSAALVIGPRIWDGLRRTGGKVGMMFFQQSLGESVDLVLSPRPVHRHHGGMIQDCYSQPPDLYGRLSSRLGRPFDVMHYWGPLASAKSTEWIVDAAEEVMRSPDLAPDVLMTYLPHLDYDLQRHGPDSRQALQALDKVYAWLADLRRFAETAGYDWLFFGDYAIEAVRGGPVFPNRLLRDAGLFAVRTVQGRAYPDFFTSRAIAVADHQVAHVFTADRDSTERAAGIFHDVQGIGEILDRAAQQRLGLDVARSGDLVLVADRGFWFAYPWWTEKGEAPDYAGHVDIHNKPGCDPCELFFGWPPPKVSADPTRVRGTHGRRGADTSVAWASSCEFAEQPQTLIDLARMVKKRLE